MTFVMILIYATFVLSGLLMLSAGLVGLGTWVMQTTYDPDAHEAH